MDYFASSDLKNLADLLNFKMKVDSDDEIYDDPNPKDTRDPYTLTCKIKSSQDENIKDERICALTEKENHENIWSDDEVLDEEDDEARIKENPEYEMVYQQSVTPDDIFLQMSGKNHGSNSCEYLLVKVKLHGIHSTDEICLNTSELKLICRTKKYYLNLDLPKEVDPTRCSAKWDQSENLLTVKLLFEACYPNI